MLKRLTLITANALMIFSVFASISFCTEVSTSFDYSVQIEGNYETQGDSGYLLSAGSRLHIAPTDEVLEQTLEAYADGVRVFLDAYGVRQASGLFALRRIGKDGTETNIPGELTASRMRIAQDEEMALEYVRGETPQPEASNWVVESEGIFRVGGKTSVERIHPPSETLPRVLISLAGKVEGTVISSNLATMGWYEGSSAKFWKKAYDDLNHKKKVVREIEVDPNRVGYRAYQKFLRETLQNLNKLGEGYDMLRQKRYTNEVLRRMVRGRADIPRLDLASFHIVAGESAFSLEVFQNWQGKGRVLANVAYLTNDGKEGTYPRLSFVLADKSGKIGEDTRLVIAEGDAYLEVTRPGTDNWRMRSPNQFDYLADITFTPGEESMRLDLDLDVTGFLLRKGMKVVGQISVGSLEISPTSLTLTYRPQAASRKVASDFSGYVALDRIILFPERDRLLNDYRPEEITEETWDFLGVAFDYLAEAVGQSRIKQIDSLVVKLERVEGKMWKLEADFKGKNGRSGHAEYRAELSENPIAFLWEKLEKSQDATEWLEIDLGLQ